MAVGGDDPHATAGKEHLVVQILAVGVVPRDVFAGWFHGARDIAEMLAYFEAHTYLDSDSSDAIVLANLIAGREPTKFAEWAKAKFALPVAA